MLLSLDLQQERLDTLLREYEEEQEILKHEFDTGKETWQNKTSFKLITQMINQLSALTLRNYIITERLMMIEKHLQEINDLADIMFAMDQNFQDRENDARSEYQSMRDEIKNKVCTYLHLLFHHY